MPYDTFGKETQSHPLLVPSSPFNYVNRPMRDRIWRNFYFVLLSASVGGSLFSLINSNPAFLSAISTDGWLDDPTHCPLLQLQPNEPQPGNHAAVEEQYPPPTTRIPSFQLRTLRAALPLFLRPSQERRLLQYAATLVAVSLSAAGLLALAFLLLLRSHATTLVFLTIVLQVSVPLAGGCLLLSRSGDKTGGLVMLGLASFLALSSYLARRSLAKVAELLRLSAQALHETPALLGLSLVLQLATGLAVVALGGGMGVSLSNGRAVPNPEGAMGSAGRCTDSSGHSVQCCSWQPDPWLAAFLPTATLTLSWTLLLMMQVKAFTVSGTVAQWYHLTARSSAGGACSGNARVMTSLGHAVGPSLGSLCLSSAVLYITSVFRSMVQSAQRRRRGEAVPSIAACLLSCLAAIVEHLTRFAVVHMSITGATFTTSGREVVALMTRNAVDAYNVWWLPPTVLRCFSAFLCLAWGGTVYLAYPRIMSPGPGPAPPEVQTAAVVLAIIAALVAGVVLHFMTVLLLTVVDTLFVLFAIDKDQRVVTRFEVHQIYLLLPGVCPECGPNHASPGSHGRTGPPRGPPPNAPPYFFTSSYGIAHPPSFTHIPNQDNNSHLSYAFSPRSQASTSSHYPHSLDVPSPYGAQQPRPTYNFHTSGVPAYQPPYVTAGKQPTAPPMDYPYPSVDLRKLQQG
ncbi:MAG: hypothetical protein WDW36_000574 [Sanguina aurantia]